MSNEKSILHCDDQLKNLKNLLNDKDLLDCTFIFGDETKISANRLILANASCVFRAMFYGKMKEDGNIYIKDISSEGFKDTIEFIYTGYIALTPETIGDIWYCANKYMLVLLEVLCNEYVNKNLENIENAKLELVLKFLNTIPRDVMPEVTFDLLISELRHKTDLIVECKYFVDISLDLLRFILSENILNIDEDKLFFATLRWCETKFENVNLPINGQNKRKILDNCEYLIRFGSMSLETFIKCNNSESGFLSANEFRDIIFDIYNKTDISPFLKYKRIVP